MGISMGHHQMGHIHAPMQTTTNQPPGQSGNMPTGPPVNINNPFRNKLNKKSPGKSQQQDFKCEYCQVFLNSQKQLEQHNASPKHITTKNSINKQMGQTVRHNGFFTFEVLDISYSQ